MTDRTYENLPTLIGELKRSAIDAYMKSQGWHIDYGDRYHLGDNEVTRPGPTGDKEALRTRSRTSSTPMESFSVRITATSAWLPTMVVWQPWQCPHPGSWGAFSHCSAAAKAMAALERPDPGGPVNSQAWLIP